MDDLKNNKFTTRLASLLSERILAKLEPLLGSLLFDNRIEWLTTKEAAAYLRVSEGNLRTKVSRGQIQVHGKLGNSWRFRRDKLDDQLNSSNKGVFDD